MYGLLALCALDLMPLIYLCESRMVYLVITRNDMADLKKITVRMVEGVPLFMPELLDAHFPTVPLEEFPKFCGAGGGIAERVVPDHVLGLSIAPSCWIHDCMFCMLSPDKDNWFIANGILILNIFMLIIVKGSNWLVVPRCIFAVPYFWAVMTGIGWRCFTNRKWIDDYDPFKDEALRHKFKQVGVLL